MIATVTSSLPSLPASHAADALMSCMFHCHEYRAPRAGLVWLLASPATCDASASATAAGISKETSKSGETSATPLAASFVAAAEVRPDTTANPERWWNEVTVPPSAATRAANAAAVVLPLTSTMWRGGRPPPPPQNIANRAAPRAGGWGGGAARGESG